MIRYFPKPMFIAAAAILGACCLYGAESDVPMNPEKAITLLKDGNERFVAGKAQHLRGDQERRTITTAHGQHPYVSVLSCSDSRVPLELIFDAGIGELFVIRVAGNVADGDEVGSLEYGVGHLETPLLLVLGHSKCGAVTAAVKNATVHGSIPLLINKIKPAVARTIKNNPHVTGDELVTAAISSNVWQAIEDIFKRSAEIRELSEKGKVQVVGGIYDIESGKVAILGQHPQQSLLFKLVEEHAEAHAAPHTAAPHAATPQAAVTHAPKTATHAAPAPAAKTFTKPASSYSTKTAFKSETKSHH